MKRSSAACVVLAVLLVTEHAEARFMAPRQVPVARLLKNVGGLVKHNPKDAHGHYLLGRINGYAYTMKVTRLHVYMGAKRPRRVVGGATGGKQPSKKALRRHLVASLRGFRSAIALKPNEALYHLGLAWILEAGASDGAKAGISSSGGRAKTLAKGKLRQLWLRRAMKRYLRAHDLAFRADTTRKYRPMRGLGSLVSYGGAHGYLRLAKQTGTAKAAGSARVKRTLAKIKSLARGPVTPLVFSLRAPASGIGALVDSSLSVRFDLDGDGQVESRRGWVRPSTALLVWDPAQRGRITSGRQLFGSVTWWMFWRDGYHALAALDDDGDGWLRGAELAGLAAWFDRDGDGRSDKGEVVSVQSLGIVGIATRSAGHTRGMPYNPAGIELAGSRRKVATYDWIAP